MSAQVPYGQVKMNLKDPDGREAYVLDFDISVAPDGLPVAQGLTITALDDNTITPETLTLISKRLHVYVDQGAALLAREKAIADFYANGGSLTIWDGNDAIRLEFGPGGQTTVTLPDGTVETGIATITADVGPEYSASVFNMLSRRRRARTTSEELQRVADIYRAAVEAGEPVQHAVRYTYDVDDPADAVQLVHDDRRGVRVPQPTLSASGARKLITKAREEGLLPATTRGKRSL